MITARHWREAREARRAQREPRWIYFAQVGADGPIKIGVSGNPWSRVAEMQTACPWELRLLAWRPGEAPDERALHQKLAQFRMRGEWFEPSTEVLEEVHRG